MFWFRRFASEFSDSIGCGPRALSWLIFADTDGARVRIRLLIGVKVLANEDLQEAIADFNGALTAARRRSTFDDDDEVKELAIAALDSAYCITRRWYREYCHDQRAAADLLTIQA
ncbi:hypothetical protein CYMTET_10424 [Cymbomonas tetramitiformis]|uniref:Uncharacterized protein n=1 Tax=Cymbomonas tetramitiformis TaxID=36881 RepID=A0AAE0GQS1_9CHLO|nr:hypothetical protein CYMTET_10424 [Cymbomonas tetramitiformis]